MLKPARYQQPLEGEPWSWSEVVVDALSAGGAAAGSIKTALMLVAVRPFSQVSSTYGTYLWRNGWSGEVTTFHDRTSHEETN